MKLFILVFVILLNISLQAQTSPANRIEDLTKAIIAAETPEIKAPLLLQRGKIKTGIDADAAMSDIQSALSLFQQHTINREKWTPTWHFRRFTSARKGMN